MDNTNARIGHTHPMRRSRAELEAIPGWGADLDRKNRPAVAMERTLEGKPYHSGQEGLPGKAGPPLVLTASKFGLPVSTTHVAVGAIAGVGSSASTRDLTTLRHVLLA